MLKLMRLAFLLKEAWTHVVAPVQLGVRIILVQDGKVLLVRHTYMEGWHFPGGGLKRWETPMEAAAREAWEESGVELLEPPTLVDIYTTYLGGNSDHVATYLCRNFRMKQATDKWEIAECKFFAIDALPLGLSPRWHKVVNEVAETVAIKAVEDKGQPTGQT